jgi:integrase
MLQALPKNYASNVFNPNKRALQSTLARSRKRIAKKLQMPNLNNIHHHSFRRYFADQAYKKTRFNVRKVQHASDINTYLQPRNTSTTSTTRTARMKRHEPTRQKKPKNSGS